MRALEVIAHVVPLGPHVISVVRDSDDNMVLECALSGGADYIISGDQDLIILKEFHGIKLLSPREFLTIIESS